VGSKRAGAEWAKATLDAKWRDLIDRAWDGRPTPELSSRQPADPQALAQTLEFLAVVMEAGRQMAAELNIEIIYRRY